MKRFQPGKTLLLIFPLTGILCTSSVVAQAPVDNARAESEARNVAAVEQTLAASDDEVEQELENPRIVAHENLDEMSQVRTVAPGEAASGSAEQDETETVEDEVGAVKGGLSDTGGGAVLDRTDRLLEMSRRPLIYVQENVSFFSKRNILFLGRLEADYAHYSDGVLEDDSGFSVRRFRLGLAGQVAFWPGWNYKVEMDLTDGENALSDAYLSRRSEKWGTFRIGNQKVAQTLSGQMSSLSIPFMERPLPVLAFTLTRRLGVGWDTHLRKLGANITVFSRDPNKGVGSKGWAVRGYFNPSRERFHVVHVGFSYMSLTSDDDARFRARPESDVTNTRLVDTGVFTGVGESAALGLELAGARGPFTLKSEFYRAEWSVSGQSDPKFSGWYAEASWFLTGEQAHYRDGKFIRPNIQRDNGAWELAFRYSSVDLNDGAVQGGLQNNTAIGINWYSRMRWRFMANLIKVRAKEGPFGKQEPWITQVRVQYFF